MTSPTITPPIAVTNATESMPISQFRAPKAVAWIRPVAFRLRSAHVTRETDHELMNGKAPSETFSDIENVEHDLCAGF